MSAKIFYVVVNCQIFICGSMLLPLNLVSFDLTWRRLSCAERRGFKSRKTRYFLSISLTLHCTTSLSVLRTAQGVSKTYEEVCMLMGLLLFHFIENNV